MKIKIGQDLKLYELKSRLKSKAKTSYVCKGDYTYQSRTKDIIVLKSAVGYVETIRIVDIRMKLYKIVVDGVVLSFPSIPDIIGEERKQREKSLQEYRQTVGKASYKNLLNWNKKRHGKGMAGCKLG